MAVSGGNVGHLREFDPANSDWSFFKRRIENYFAANDTKDDNRKAVILLNVLNEDAYKLVFNLCLPVEPEKSKYSELIKLLSEHFKPNVYVFSARYKFYNSRKNVNESAREWSARIRNLAALCNFDDEQLELVLRDHFVIGYDKGSVQDRLFEEKKTLTFKAAVEIATAKSTTFPPGVEREISIKKEPELFHVKNKDRTKPSTSQACYQYPQRPNNINRSKQVFHSKCKVCGRKYHFTDKCSFRECICHIFDIKEHLAPMCPNKKNNKNKQNFVNNKVSQNYLESDYSLFNLDCTINPISIKLIINKKLLDFS
ncbi:hypothetical protein RN001_005167 [Aquatica leii]|uniref:Uncharacterized protein n=1 Tax=Aquatica leii TaxID=1421715 RepID=A0AAN7SPS4_9COLE|nr:hypothetical protein RN001_005167 [Aquatica leii]